MADIAPKTGFQGLIENWQSDIIAALSVALIALPLSLGIALAAGAPAMAGVISAVVGGVVTTFYRGGHIAVNGPAKGVIAVILAGIAMMDDGSGQAFNYVLAAIVVSGALQVIMGMLKLGRFADLFHSSVIHGLLAAIGIIIFAKQIHVAMGTYSQSPNIVQNLFDAVLMLPQANPFVVIISLAGFVLMIFHSRISYKFFHFLPTPMWVIALSIPFAYFFDFFKEQDISLFGKAYHVGPKLLLDIPDNVMASIMHPNFGMIDTPAFWITVFSIPAPWSPGALAAYRLLLSSFEVQSMYTTAQKRNCCCCSSLCLGQLCSRSRCVPLRFFWFTPDSNWLRQLCLNRCSVTELNN